MSFDTGLGNNSLACPQCGQPVPAQVEQVIDVGRDPSAKARFLSGQTNTLLCPQCGYRAGLATPLVYHDPAKELLLIFVPMELGLPQQEQEQVTGQLIKAVMDNTPAEQRKGYLFQPRSVLSMQGMVEAILGADGVTPEMLEAQREKMRIVEIFLQANEDSLPGLAQQYDAQIDAEFFQILAVAAQNAQAAGRPELVQHAGQIQQTLLELTTVGQELLQESQAQEAAIETVVQALQGLGEGASLDDFLDLVIGFAGDDHYVQALVGLQYPAFDYNFFQALAGRIEQAQGEEQAQLEALREQLSAMTNAIRQQQEASAGQAAQLLSGIMQSEDLEAAVRANIPNIDETFMAVLGANIQAAQEKGDLINSGRLKKVSDTITKLVEASVPPELRFISRVLQEETEEAAQAIMDAEAATFGPELLPLMDIMLEDVLARGEAVLADRLRWARDYATQVLGS